MCSFWRTVEFALAKELVRVLRMGFLTLFAITTEPVTATEKEATAKPTATRIPSPDELEDVLHPEWGEERFKLKARPQMLEGRLLQCSMLGLLDASSRVQDHRRRQ